MGAAPLLSGLVPCSLLQAVRVCSLLVGMAVVEKDVIVHPRRSPALVQLRTSVAQQPNLDVRASKTAIMAWALPCCSATLHCNPAGMCMRLQRHGGMHGALLERSVTLFSTRSIVVVMLRALAMATGVNLTIKAGGWRLVQICNVLPESLVYKSRIL